MIAVFQGAPQKQNIGNLVTFFPLDFDLVDSLASDLLFFAFLTFSFSSVEKNCFQSFSQPLISFFFPKTPYLRWFKMCCSWFECWRQFLTLFCLFSSFFFHFSLFKLSRSSTIISILSGREIGLSFLHTVIKGQLNRKKQRESVTKNITKQNTYPNSTKKSTKINKNRQKKREKWKGVFASKRGKKTGLIRFGAKLGALIILVVFLEF